MPSVSTARRCAIGTPVSGSAVRTASPNSPCCSRHFDGFERSSPACALRCASSSAYSPELNAIERVWQYLRDRYLSGRLFPGARAIVDACCEAWNRLLEEAGRLRSLTNLDWITGVRT